MTQGILLKLTLLFHLLEEIYYRFYPQLVESLPMKEPMFLAHLTQLHLLPGDLKQLINSKGTSTEATTCFLDNMIGPAIECGNHETFNLLITVMEKSDNIILNNIAQNIRKEIQGTIRKSIDMTGKYK